MRPPCRWRSPRPRYPARPHVGGELEACKEPLCYTASKLEADRNRMVLHDINIVDTTRGITHIKADLAEATGADLGNSDWVLTGHVQASLPQGTLRADRATVQFVNKRIASMSAQGAPARIRTQRGSQRGRCARGRWCQPQPRPGRQRARPCARDHL